MMTFSIVAAMLALVAMGVVVRPLLRRADSGPDVRRDLSNVAILRDQLAELESDLAAGVISPEQHREAKAELERRVLEEGRAVAASAPAASRGGKRTALALALAIPVVAGLLYFQLGSRDAFSPMAEVRQGDSDHALTQEQVEQMVAKLAERLKEKPDDPQGWSILARSYYVMGRFGDAAQAYAKLAALVPNDADVLADYADSLAMTQGRSLKGKPMELVQQALKLDPNQWKALAMAGTEAFDRKDYRAAVGYWEKVRAGMPAESEMAQAIDSSIAEARELGGMKPPQAAATPPASAPLAQATKPQAAAPASGGGQVGGTVMLSGALSGKADPNDTLFIFARAAEGPRMPLAILRVQVKDLPVKFTLDDSMAMSPAMKLSAFSDVVVGARISKSASATPQSGDLEGLSAPAKVGSTGMQVVIDRVIP